MVSVESEDKDLDYVSKEAKHITALSDPFSSYDSGKMGWN